MPTSENIKFKFFNIKNLGYYNFENEDFFPIHHQVLDELSVWAKSRGTLINTSCYEKNIHENIYGTYFYDYINFNGKNDGLLILWNEIENNDGGVFSINQYTKPGHGKIEKKNFGNNNIPGKPSYFWFNFEKNIMASIGLETSSTKKSNVERYLLGFLRNHTKYKIHDSSGNHITNYLDPNSKKQLLHSSYPNVKFSSQKNLNIRNDALLRYQEITKLISKESLLWKKNRP